MAKTIDRQDFFNPEHWETVPVIHRCRACNQETENWVIVNVSRPFKMAFDGFLCMECASPILAVVEHLR